MPFGLLFSAFAFIPPSHATPSKFNISKEAHFKDYGTNVDHLHDDMFHYWYVIPNIVICHGSKITKSQVQDAVHFWTDKGFRLGYVYLETETKIVCPSQYGEDFKVDDIIYITEDLTSMSVDNWGITQRYYHWCDFVGPRHENHCIPAQGLHSFVISAHIQLSDDVQQHDNPTSLIAHELGHALGFSHIDIRNDVMYGD